MKIFISFLIYFGLVFNSLAVNKSEKSIISINYNDYISSELHGHQILVTKEKKPTIIFTSKNGTEIFLEKGTLKFNLNSNLGNIELFLKNNYEQKKIGLYLSGPRIFFKTDPNCSLKTSSESIDVLAAKVDGLAPVSGLIENSCNSFGIDSLKLTKIYTIGINSEEINTCLNHVDFKKTLKNLNIDKLLFNLKEKYAKAKLESNKSSNLILKCATSFESNNRDIMFSENTDGKISIGFQIDPKNKGVIVSDKKSNCRKNIEYSIFHEMLHISGVKSDIKVDEIVNYCRKINKDSCEEIQSIFEENNEKINVKNASQIIANDQTVAENEKFREQKNEQLAQLVPLDLADPIPEKIIQAVQNNPVNSPEFNNGIQLLANNMIGKMNTLEDAVNKAFMPGVIPKSKPNPGDVPGNTPPSTPKYNFQPMKIAEMINDPQIRLEVSPKYGPTMNNDNKNEAQFESKTKNNNKTTTAKAESNRLPASVSKANVASFVPEMPFLATSVDTGVKNDANNEARTKGNQKVLEKAATAIKQLVSFGGLPANKWSELKPSLLDKEGVEVLQRMRIAIIDKQNNKTFGYKEKNPAYVFVDNGSEIRISNGQTF